MVSVNVRTISGGDAGSVDLDDELFGIEPNVGVMHQVVTAQLAAARAGTSSTKTRSEVSGGGAKPWKQKGTGRARQGSIRAPHWRGGGIAHGPKPRDYSQRTNKKMIKLALRSALSDRASDGKVVVVDAWTFDQPRTRSAKAALAALGVEGRVLVVLDRDDEVARRSFRNLPEVHLLPADQLNTYDVLVSDFVVFTQGTLPRGVDAADRTGTADPAVPVVGDVTAPPVAGGTAATPAGDETTAAGSVADETAAAGSAADGTTAAGSVVDETAAAGAAADETAAAGTAADETGAS